ncbi:MAG: hypothetical protein IT377_07365 [Polyangiaceae bacterium]|nr:hypothetical protein [Polyangiaceae bacterium]
MWLSAIALGSVGIGCAAGTKSPPKPDDSHVDATGAERPSCTLDAGSPNPSGVLVVGTCNRAAAMRGLTHAKVFLSAGNGNELLLFTIDKHIGNDIEGVIGKGEYPRIREQICSRDTAGGEPTCAGLDDKTPVRIVFDDGSSIQPSYGLRFWHRLSEGVEAPLKSAHGSGVARAKADAHKQEVAKAVEARRQDLQDLLKTGVAISSSLKTTVADGRYCVNFTGRVSCDAVGAELRGEAIVSAKGMVTIQNLTSSELRGEVGVVFQSGDTTVPSKCQVVTIASKATVKVPCDVSMRAVLGGSYRATAAYFDVCRRDGEGWPYVGPFCGPDGVCENKMGANFVEGRGGRAEANAKCEGSL